MKTQLLAFSLISLVFFGCKKIDKLTQFDMEFNQEIVFPASAGINLPFDIQTPEIESDTESSSAVNNTRKDLIEEIKLSSMTLTIKTPADGDFSFLKSISIYIKAEGLAEEKIAWADEVSDDIGLVLDLETSGVDLKEFIKKDKFSLRLKTVTDKLLNADHEVNVKSVFFVDAKVLGI